MKEINKLRSQNQQLRADLESAKDSLAEVQAQRNKYLHEVEQARTIISKFRVTLERRVEQVRLQERKSIEQQMTVADGLRGNFLTSVTRTSIAIGGQFE